LKWTHIKQFEKNSCHLISVWYHLIINLNRKIAEQRGAAWAEWTSNKLEILKSILCFFLRNRNNTFLNYTTICDEKWFSLRIKKFIIMTKPRRTKTVSSIKASYKQNYGYYWKIRTVTNFLNLDKTAKRWQLSEIVRKLKKHMKNYI